MTERYARTPWPLSSAGREPKEGRHNIGTTDRNTFKRCRTQWDFTSPLRQNLEPLRTARALSFGTNIHAALEYFYDPKLWKEGRAEVLEQSVGVFTKLQMQIRPENLDGSDYQTWLADLELGVGMLDNYAKWAPDQDKFEPVYTEIKFEVPILVGGGGGLYCECHSWPVNYAGRIDLIVKDTYGKYWVYDHKTTASLTNIDWLSFDEQISSYCWAIQHVLGIKIEGFVYNELVKTAPHPPRVLKNGLLSKDKSQNTTFDLYLTALREGGYDTESYLDILNYLKEQENKYFRRTQVKRSSKELELLGKRIAVEAAEMIRLELPIYQSPSKMNCSYCAFNRPCLALLDGSDFDPMMSEFYQIRSKEL